jgi:hypothetical protein
VGRSKARRGILAHIFCGEACKQHTELKNWFALHDQGCWTSWFFDLKPSSQLPAFYYRLQVLYDPMDWSDHLCLGCCLPRAVFDLASRSGPPSTIAIARCSNYFEIWYEPWKPTVTSHDHEESRVHAWSSALSRWSSTSFIRAPPNNRRFPHVQCMQDLSRISHPCPFKESARFKTIYRPFFTRGTIQV